MKSRTSHVPVDGPGDGFGKEKMDIDLNAPALEEEAYECNGQKSRGDYDVAVPQISLQEQFETMEGGILPVNATMEVARRLEIEMSGNIATQTVASEESDEDGEEVDSQEPHGTPPESFTSMMFDSWEEAKVCYNRYAKKIGFSVKIGTSKTKGRDIEKGKVMFVCNKNGSNKDTSEGPVVKKRRRNITEKTGCKARMIVNLRDAKWIVTTFIEEHNHPLCDKFELKKFLRSHRGIPDEERKFVELLHQANISSRRI
ncbi:hypothetical protein U9M48_024030 [Paspalum notatum var. saurae]|uniref:FAR1 domain-containing protein n=1 Tax=Paspalum notatum var. saurae TaxID=547442 RepID=A0AAQ3TQJ4_PASNO